MAIDARPFRTLTTPSGASIKCLPPKLLPLSQGIIQGATNVSQDAPTHTIDVMIALGSVPVDLEENAIVTVDVLPGKNSTFRVLRNGIDIRPDAWKLYVRSDENLTGYEP